MAIDDNVTVLGGAGLAAYPHVFPPAGSEEILEVGLYSSVANPETKVLASVNITGSYKGWITQIALQGSNFAKVFFTVKRGGSPIRGYTRVNVPLGAPETPKACLIKMEPDIPLTLEANFTSAAIAVRWVLWGWYYREDSNG